MYNLNQLWERYLFNRDMGDIQRANYWMARIQEHEQSFSQTQKKSKS